MAAHTKLEQFLKTSIGSAGRLSSLILLVNRAIILIKEIQQTPELREENSRKVRNILAQLQMALNFQSDTVTQSLFFLYDYLFEQMTIADDEALEASLKLLTQLRDTLTELKRKSLS